MKGRPKVTKELRGKSAAIARRLKEARSAIGISQEVAASRCGVKRVSFAAYEEGRNVVPAGVAMLFCLAFNVSFRWLATGKGQLSGCESLPTADVLLVPDDAAYSTAFDEFIGPGITSSIGAHQVPNPTARLAASETLQMLRDRWVKTIPEQDLEEFIELVAFVEHQFCRTRLEFMRRFSREFRNELAAFPGKFSEALAQARRRIRPM